MIHTLQPSEYPIARPVRNGIDHLLLAEAVVEGTAPGWVAVDGRTASQTLVISGPDGHSLAGDSEAAFRNLQRALDKGSFRQAGY